MNAPRTIRYAAVIAAGLLCLVQTAPASAGSPPPYPPGRHHSAHYSQRHYAGPRYVVVDRLPRGCRHVVYRGQPYYYHGASWYRPHGVRFVAVAPPIGVIVDGRGATLAARVPLVRW
jgi:Family of unknown function (DUF6515)